jgi:hypothetical protein
VRQQLLLEFETVCQANAAKRAGHDAARQQVIQDRQPSAQALTDNAGSRMAG